MAASHHEYNCKNCKGKRDAQQGNYGRLWHETEGKQSVSTYSKVPFPSLSVLRTQWQVTALCRSIGIIVITGIDVVAQL